jgi:hypothetical protein
MMDSCLAYSSPWRWRTYVSPKSRSTSDGLHVVISLKIEVLFATCFMLVSLVAYFSTLMLRATCFSETSVNFNGPHGVTSQKVEVFLNLTLFLHNKSCTVKLISFDIGKTQSLKMKIYLWINYQSCIEISLQFYCNRILFYGLLVYFRHF